MITNVHAAIANLVNVMKKKKIITKIIANAKLASVDNFIINARGTSFIK
ncbi:hypothetical protein K9L05_01390 [Candidatus Babeliales bacterium]|nr:hypothetical protein [Candidatus Babeliales bacterium]MCF7899285.1 hypothetical protein [Candidatus Babeliales bacterium]